LSKALNGLDLLDLGFARTGAEPADLLERIAGLDLRGAAGRDRSSGGAGRGRFGFGVLRSRGGSDKAAATRQLAVSIQNFFMSSSLSPCRAFAEFFRRHSIALAPAAERVRHKRV
jgi:hypothetical protein